MPHVISENESESSGGGMAARRQPRPPPGPPPPLPTARQRIDNVDTLLNHIRQKSTENLVHRASALPEMRGRSAGFVDQLGKCTDRYQLFNAKCSCAWCIRCTDNSYLTIYSAFSQQPASRGVSQVHSSQTKREDLDATVLSPSGEVDAIWHCHLLDTRDYMSACTYLLSRDDMIHHDPDGGDDAAAQKRRLSRTREDYREIFGYLPSSYFWG